SNRAPTQHSLPKRALRPAGSATAPARLTAHHLGREAACVDAQKMHAREYACACLIVSVFACDPIQNSRRCHGLLRRMGIQGPGNRTPAVLDDLLGKLPRIDFS